MTIARKEVLIAGEATYHCISRCVRQAYLCGTDKESGRVYEHRKAWARERLKFLTEIFCVEVLGYALMDNHQHTLLRTRPDLETGLSDHDISRRWLRLYPNNFSRVPGSSEPSEEAIELLAQDPTRVAVLRERLTSISWFMKCFSEAIAKRANAEDGCKGRFWEGRFKAQRLCDEAAILACCLYVDLNPIRAKMARTPEKSKFTSAHERIRLLRYKVMRMRTRKLWLAPVQTCSEGKGFLSISVQQYLELLDAIGRELRTGKRGKIPPHLPGILQRIGLVESELGKCCIELGSAFSRVIGSPRKVASEVDLRKKRWIKGGRAASRFFMDIGLAA